MMFRELFPSCMIDLVFPRECRLCGTLAEGNQRFSGALCPECRDSLSESQVSICGRCGSPVPDAFFLKPDSCWCCADRELHLHGLLTIGSYGKSKPIRSLILALKHGGDTGLAADFAALIHQRLIQRMPGNRFHAVAAVPLHRSRYRKRKYNQAELIGKHLARRLEIPYYTWLLKRVRRTAPQSGGMAERWKNVQGAFRAGGKFENARLLLVDDVLTTGATARECSRMLVRAGCREIVVATCAWVPVENDR